MQIQLFQVKCDNTNGGEHGAATEIMCLRLGRGLTAMTRDSVGTVGRTHAPWA
jgi:hypothetical protein